MKKLVITASLLLSLCASTVFAGTVKLPEEKSAVSVVIPDDWSPETDEGGVQAESPDQVATVYFELVSTEEEIKNAVESSLEWLIEECDVKVDADSMEEKDFKVGERDWSRISWKGTHKDSGPALIGFLMTEVGQGKVLTVTYWISTKDSEKSLKTLEEIFTSVKSLE